MRRERAITPLPCAVKTLSAAVASSIALSLAATPAHAASPAPTAVPALGLAIPANAPAPTHTVGAGDSVYSIAQRYGLSTADVLAWNGLSWADSTIRPGQVLQLAAPAGTAPPAASAAPAPAAPAPAVPAPAPGNAAHTVVAGDTLFDIARGHGIGVQALLDANGLVRGSIIYPGQVLTIPAPGAAPAAPAAAAPPPAPAPAASAASHTVVAGDTVIGIAAQHGVAADALLAANGLEAASIIYPGQVLAVPSTALAGLDAEQIGNARLIVRIGRELGVSDRGIAIALGTAMVESWLRNLDWGDRDSLGLFQQRSSQGWGSEADVRDADRATRAFYGGPADPNGTATRGLLDIPGWEGQSFADAAQSVQISAYPERYAVWEAPASAWLAALG